MFESFVAVVDDLPVRRVEVYHLLFVGEQHAAVVVVSVQFLIVDALPCVLCPVVR